MTNRRIIQLAIVAAVSLAASGQARANVAYGGGRVLSPMRIVPIFYGSSWTTSERLRAQNYCSTSPGI